YRENNIVMKSGVSLVSVDGPLKAKIYSGTKRAIYFSGTASTPVENVSVDGFDIFGDWNQGSAGDGLIRVLNARNIQVRNSMVHDAPHDQDCIKVSGYVDGFLMENLIIWNPGKRQTGLFQENIDIFGNEVSLDGRAPVRNITLRGSWLFHAPGVGGKALVYAKVYVENIIYEDNFFGPVETPGGEGVPVNAGGYTSGSNNPNNFTGERLIVRNNVFVGMRGDGALGIGNTNDVWIYNNVFYGNSGPELRSVVQFEGFHMRPGVVHIFNNIFQNNYPSRKGGLFFRARNNGEPTNLMSDNNLYYNNISTSSVSYQNETGSIYDQLPQLKNPRIPDVTVLPTSLDILDAIKSDFAPLNNSPVIDKGVSAADRPNFPSSDWDSIAQRACDSSQKQRIKPWDMGISETISSQVDTMPPGRPGNAMVK
ncbi:MAG: hypothetical protein ACE5FU_11125, partial [Nitrospinota bacterium]